MVFKIKTKQFWDFQFQSLRTSVGYIKWRTIWHFSHWHGHIVLILALMRSQNCCEETVEKVSSHFLMSIQPDTTSAAALILSSIQSLCSISQVFNEEQSDISKGCWGVLVLLRELINIPDGPVKYLLSGQQACWHKLYQSWHKDPRFLPRSWMIMYEM